MDLELILEHMNLANWKIEFGYMQEVIYYDNKNEYSLELYIVVLDTVYVHTLML